MAVAYLPVARGARAAGWLTLFSNIYSSKRITLSEARRRLAPRDIT